MTIDIYKGLIPLSIPSIIVFLFLCYVVFSFGEYQIHKYFMHKKIIPKWFCEKFPEFKDTYEAHAIRHHGIWYRKFDFEPSPEGRNDNIQFRPVDSLMIFVLVLPINILFFVINPIFSVSFTLIFLIHNYLWNVLHTQMHIPQSSFFADWQIFRWLAIHHYMHHQVTNSNFNIVFPLADYLLGTKKYPRTKDIRELLRLGYLKPRTTRTQVQLNKIREQVAVQRQALLC